MPEKSGPSSSEAAVAEPEPATPAESPKAQQSEPEDEGITTVAAVSVERLQGSPAAQRSIREAAEREALARLEQSERRTAEAGAAEGEERVREEAERRIREAEQAQPPAEPAEPAERPDEEAEPPAEQPTVKREARP